MIILYTTHCPKCKILETKLKLADVKYEAVTDMDVMLSKGYLFAPVLEVNDEVFNFAQALRWLSTER